MKKHAARVAKSTKVRFAAIGIVNTAIDFVILNLLAHAVGLPRIPSNIASASVAMMFSFFANRSVVFNAKSGKARHQAMMFVLVTITGVYGLQNLIIWILADVWTCPLDTAHDILGVLDKEVFVTNASKRTATGQTGSACGP